MSVERYFSKYEKKKKNTGKQKRLDYIHCTLSDNNRRSLICKMAQNTKVLVRITSKSEPVITQ